MPEYYLVQDENGNVNVEGAEKQDDDNKRVPMDAFLGSAQLAPSTGSRPFLL